jgi:hypothetical protein
MSSVTVLWLAELQFLMAVQHHFRMQYGCQPPTRKSIRIWDNKVRTTGSLLHVKSPERHGSLKKMEIALERHSSKVCANKFVLLACSYVQIPCPTVHNVLHKRLHVRVYQIQLIHTLKLSDQVARTDFAVDMLERLDASPYFLHQVCFSDEVTFHVSGV